MASRSIDGNVASIDRSAEERGNRGDNDRSIGESGNADGTGMDGTVQLHIFSPRNPNPGSTIEGP